MLIDFFHHLKAGKLPVSTKEFLTLLEALQKHVAGHSIDEFYYLSRACLVKDESNYDKFDKAFGEYFRGVERIPGLIAGAGHRILQCLPAGHRSRRSVREHARRFRVAVGPPACH